MKCATCAVRAAIRGHVGSIARCRGFRAAAWRSADGEALAVAAGGAPADRAGRHPRVLPDRQVQRKEMAGRLLAGIAGAAQRGGVDQGDRRHYRRDRKALQRLAANTRIDLLATIPHGTGQTLPARDPAGRRSQRRITSGRSSPCAGSSASGRSCRRVKPARSRRMNVAQRSSHSAARGPASRRLPTSCDGSAPCRRRIIQARCGRSACARSARPRPASNKRSRSRADRPHLAAARHAAFRRARRRPLDADASSRRGRSPRAAPRFMQLELDARACSRRRARSIVKALEGGRQLSRPQPVRAARARRHRAPARPRLAHPVADARTTA